MFLQFIQAIYNSIYLSMFLFVSSLCKLSVTSVSVSFFSLSVSSVSVSFFSLCQFLQSLSVSSVCQFLQSLSVSSVSVSFFSLCQFRQSLSVSFVQVIPTGSSALLRVVGFTKKAWLPSQFSCILFIDGHKLHQSPSGQVQTI